MNINELRSLYSTELTFNNYYEKVEASNDVWLVLMYEPNSDASINFMNVWDSIGEKLNSTIKMGRINAIKEKDLYGLLPIKPKFYPFIYLWAPQKPYELLRIEEATNTDQMLRMVREIMSAYVTSVAYDNSADFFGYKKPNENTEAFNRFSISIASKKNLSPTIFLKLAMKYSNIINFGSIAFHDRSKIIRRYDCEIEHNVLIGYDAAPNKRKVISGTIEQMTYPI